MAVVKRFIAYSLPEDVDSDKIQLWTSTTEAGTYTLDTTLNYSYGSRATEAEDINTEKWYKIRFRNSVDGTNSAYSDVFYGGNADEREPFATVSTTFDGAGYGTVSGVYNLSNLTVATVPISDVQVALKTARSYIDLVTDDQGPGKYSRDWGTDITRRKYNASLEMIKQCEQNFALAIIYRNLADDTLTASIDASGTVVSGWITSTPDLSAIADVSGVANVSGAVDVSASDVTLSSGISIPPDLTLTADIDPTGLVVPGDILATPDLSLRADITGTSGDASNLAAGATLAVGQTSVSDIARSSTGVSREDTRAEEHNVNKDIAVYDHNDNKHIATSGYNYEKNIAFSDHNAELVISTEKYNNDTDVEELRENLDKNVIARKHNDSKLIEEARFNLDKDLAIDERNTAKELDLARFNFEQELEIAKFNHQKALDIAQFNHNKDMDLSRLLDSQTQKDKEAEAARALEVADLYDRMSRRYAERGNELLAIFQPTTINLRYGEDRSKSKFLNPTDIFSFAMTNVSTETVFSLYTAGLTGLGDDFSASGFILNAAAMASNPVEGVNGQDVVPLESRTTLVDSKLVINGITYFLDEWVDNNGVTQDGVTSAGTSGGYKLSYDTAQDAISMEWLYNAAAGGFDITATDEITFSYYVI